MSCTSNISAYLKVDSLLFAVPGIYRLWYGNGMDMKCLYSHIHKRLGVNIELIIQEIRCLIITHDMTATYSKVFESMGYTLDGYSIVLLYRTPD